MAFIQFVTLSEAEGSPLVAVGDLPPTFEDPRIWAAPLIREWDPFVTLCHCEEAVGAVREPPSDEAISEMSYHLSTITHEPSPMNYELSTISYFELRI